MNTFVGSGPVRLLNTSCRFLTDPVFAAAPAVFRVHAPDGGELRGVPRVLVSGALHVGVAGALPHRGPSPHRQPRRLLLPRLRQLQGACVASALGV